MASWGAGPQVILRVVQAVLALVAFAASAYIQSKGEGSPMINFMVFTGVTAWLLAMFYAAVSCVERLQRLFKGAVEVAITSIWLVFWLAAAASYSAFGECKIKDATYRTFSNCDALLASSAFAWMSVILWIPSLVLAVIDLRRGDGVTGGRYGY